MPRKKFSCTVGIEIECLVPDRLSVDRRSHVNPSGISADNPDLGFMAGWRSGYDASIETETGYYGVEFNSPVFKFPHDLPKIASVIERLKALGVKVNSTCGGHIHVGVKSVLGETFSEGKLLGFFMDLHALMESVEGAIYAYSGGKKRQESTYCKPEHTDQLKHKAFSQFEERSRYQALNIASYWKHGTVEFRIFTGTIDPLEWQNNITLAARMVQAVMDSGITPPKPPLSRDEPGLRALETLFGFAPKTFKMFDVPKWGVKMRKDQKWIVAHEIELDTICISKHHAERMAAYRNRSRAYMSLREHFGSQYSRLRRAERDTHQRRSPFGNR